MFDVVQAAEQLVGVVLRHAAVFGAAVRQNPQDPHPPLIEERQHFVVQEVRRDHGGLFQIHLRETDVGMHVDPRLLVDAPDPLDPADVEGVLANEEPRGERLDLPVGLLLLFDGLQGLDLAFRQNPAVGDGPLFQTGQALLFGLQPVP